MGGQVHIHLYDHLVYENGCIRPQKRLEPAEKFANFEAYRSCIQETLAAVGENLRDPLRCLGITPVATISNGYDSSAAAVLAERLALPCALSIDRGGILSHRYDSGASIASVLGIPVQRRQTRDSKYKDHLLIWAGAGRSLDLNMTLFDLSDDLKLMINGTHGDRVWQQALDRTYREAHHFLDRDPSGLGMVEWHLHRGIVLAAVPFIGASQLDCLARISDAAEMDPWRIGGTCDRPFARRIVEQRSVPRNAFGRRRTQTASRTVLHPRDPEHQTDLAQFLIRHKKKLPIRLGPLQRLVDLLTNLSCSVLNPKRQRGFDDLYFVWANTFLADNVYRAGLDRE